MSFQDSHYFKMNKKIVIQNLLEINRISKIINLPMFLDGGTLLGAIRSRDFIPWDNDIDIGILAEEFQIKMLEAFCEAGFDTLFGCGVYFNPTTPFIAGMCLKKGVTINVRFYTLRGDKRIAYRCSSIFRCSVNSKIWFENLKEIVFLGDTFYVPNPPEKYLKNIFGETWRIPLQKFQYTCFQTVENYVIRPHQIYKFRSVEHTKQCLRKALENETQKRKE